MLVTLLAKGIGDFTFGGAFLWYLAKYLVCGVLAFVAILCGIKLRKKKNAKVEAVEATEAKE